jgi:arsenate reductase (glutaredoxin)
MTDNPFPVVVFHNPDCGTSRNAVAIITAAGYKPTIIEYLVDGWTRPHLLALFAGANVTARQALRTSKSPAQALGLLDDEVSDEALLAAMLDHPILVNRPFVVTPKGTRLCRPSEAVLGLLEKLPSGPFFKEDGEVLIDAQGVRVG